MNDKETWKAVDAYFDEKLHISDETTEAIKEKNDTEELPAIEVASTHGKMLYLMAKMRNANTILEIGTHGGYSTVWLARALPEGGQMATLEADEKHARVAEENINAAGYGDVVHVVQGTALDTLPSLMEKGYRHFDFIFIDANKENYPEYLKWALEFSKSGAVIVADNVVRNGRIIDGDTEEKQIPYLREFIDILSEDDRIEATAVQTVGVKGYDGFLLGIVK
ncbi:O-methyltransferase [Salinicoccus sp. HZC-1]|uniref:O-methyltransferase n=1 Tax=Salinicoccus sp. HZC-1 TaxID=3385497 RepID=UPI00398B6442